MSSVYGVSVDSRSRNPDELDYDYTVQLFRDLNRVKSVQLGSFQFQDERYAFTDNSTLTFSEPLLVPPNSYIRFTETTTTLNTTTNQMTSESRRVSMLMPTTLNKVTAMSDGTLELSTQFDHGAVFGTNFYPLIGKRMSLVGGDFPQDLHAFTTPSFPTDSPEPVITTNTINSPFFTGDSRTFTWATDYLDEITGSVGSPTARIIDTTGDPDNYHSYIFAPPPTFYELTIMMNAAATFMNNRVDLSGVVTSASFATPIVVVTAGVHGLSTGDEVVISGVVGNDAANGTFLLTALTTTTFELDDSVGVGAGAGGAWFSPQTLNMSVNFGFDNTLNEIVGYSAKRVTESGNLVVTRSVRVNREQLLLGPGDVPLDPPTTFVIPPRFLRDVNITPGNYLPDEIAEEMTNLMNPQDFSVTATADRTFNYTITGGSPASLVIDFGRYTGDQLAEWMTAYLTLAPSNTTVTFSQTTNKFTIAHNLGLKFSINFAGTPRVAEKLGFDPVEYAEATSFTSVRATGHGTATATLPPANRYSVSTIDESKQFRFSTENPTRFYVESGSSTLQVGASWAPLVNDGFNFAHTYQFGSVLTATRPTLSSTQAGTKAITDATNASPIVVTTAAAHGLTTGDNLTIELVQGNAAANGTWFVTVTGATTFSLDASVGDGTYTAATGQWWTNVSFVTGAQRPSTVFTVVVQTAWDASTGLPLLTLDPTASIFSAEDAGTANRETLGSPGTTDCMILLHDDRQNVFMLHIKHPDGAPEAFGFPPVAWPPSRKTVVFGGTGIGVAALEKHALYDPSFLGIPVSTSYTSPYTWNMLPPDYILVIIDVNCTSQDIHTHSFRGESFPIFAKLLVTTPFQNISEQLHFSTFAGNARFNNLVIRFKNPDGTPVLFNGRPHTYTLLFTLHEDTAVLPCM